MVAKDMRSGRVAAAAANMYLLSATNTTILISGLNLACPTSNAQE